jgi:putative chromate ion transporter
VVLAAGLIGIYIDSFAERRWQRWRRIRRLAAKRRERLAEQRARGFVGGYVTRAMADERVRLAAIEDEEESAQAETEAKQSQDTSLRSIAILAAGMPVLAKIGLLAVLSMIFLRIGTVTFGGGFVMVPLIEAEVVNTHGWLTHQEFADATALGQLTPGPVLITATFIGYRVAGTLGALFATVSVFLPAFVMTILTSDAFAPIVRCRLSCAG